jgi:glycosyltransferase involved in cell wall biosynthesis
MISAPKPHIDESQPLVSAIMIFRDEERFIRQAIESVFAQAYDEWELLLVDDGSQDGSAQIARDYARRFPQKVRCLEHPHRESLGMSASRNLGIDNAKAELIAFLDADDVWLPDKLAEQIAILRSYPEAAMVYGATQYWYGWTGDAKDEARDFVARLDVEPETLVRPPLLVNSLLRNQVATATAGLIRREAARQVGGYENSFRGLFEDQVFHSKVCLERPVYVSSRCWYRYRRHADSCCTQAAGDQERSARLAFLDWLEKYSRLKGSGNDETYAIIERERWKSRHPLVAGAGRNLRYRMGMTLEGLKSVARHTLPAAARRWIRGRRRGSEAKLPIGEVKFGDLDRLTPVSRVFGFDRGTPVDRYYIEHFLERNAHDIRGRVLEVGDNSYTMRFGGEQVAQSDVLHVDASNPQATVIADLARADDVPSNSFDCIILTQTLHLIYDLREALSTLHRILTPGGVLLATAPGISQIDKYEWAHTWYWSFTELSAKRLLLESFVEGNVSIETHGNVFAATSFLHGISVEELETAQLDYDDPAYPVTIAMRAKKEGGV